KRAAPTHPFRRRFCLAVGIVSGAVAARDSGSAHLINGTVRGHRGTTMRLTIHRSLLVVVLLLLNIASAKEAKPDTPPPCSRPACRAQIDARCGTLSGKD